MTDYGHDLQFGTFVTPTVQQPELAGRAGPDHRAGRLGPCRPSRTIPTSRRSRTPGPCSAYVAARTRRVHLAPNVLNLPLRLPSVVARAAAGFDLLTDGRIELGLGAGGFWDPIVAMGGPRRSPGEAVQAVEEAIEIIRGIWDVDAPGGAARSRVGTTRCPAPNAGRHRPIPSRSGSALQTEMLRLVGRAADGWLPS